VYRYVYQVENTDQTPTHQLGSAPRLGMAAMAAMAQAAESSNAALESVAWLQCGQGGRHYAWDAYGRRMLRSACNEQLPLPEPPAFVHYGGAPGDESHQRLTSYELEALLGFELSASLCVHSPELLRNLPLENLDPEALPSDLAPPDGLDTLALASHVRIGWSHPGVYVASDSYGGHGLFAAEALPPLSIIGEYIGTLARNMHSCSEEAEEAIQDMYVMRYPDTAGGLSLSARFSGSLSRFLNHAERGSATCNCTIVAILVDGAFHLCVITSRAVCCREQLAFDYGRAYWDGRNLTPEK
jgi:hypothetical protein